MQGHHIIHKLARVTKGQVEPAIFGLGTGDEGGAVFGFGYIRGLKNGAATRVGVALMGSIGWGLPDVAPDLFRVGMMVHAPWPHPDDEAVGCGGTTVAGNRSPETDLAAPGSALYQSAVDESVGRVRAAIQEKGLADKTLVIFTSDQGSLYEWAPYRGYKRVDTLCEGGARVPTVIQRR